MAASQLNTALAEQMRIRRLAARSRRNVVIATNWSVRCADESVRGVLHRPIYSAHLTQAQCRSNWETLNEIKNPRPVAFIKQQTNVAAGHQQVNNGLARENESPPTKLNGQSYEPTMDAGSATPAIAVDPAVAAVGALDGAAIGGGKGEVIPEPVSRRRTAHAARARKTAKRS